MRPKIGKVFVVLLISGVVVAMAEWLGGPGAGGIALTSVGVLLGGYYGADWGGAQATKTEEYRQEWLAKRKSSAADTDDTPDGAGKR